MNNIYKNILLFPLNVLYKISPATELKILFFLKHGYKLNLKDPKTYSEKLQWVKLYEDKSLMSICADKYLVRDYVKKKGLENILNTLLWSGTDPNKIPFEELPEKFVIKISNGSTLNIICKDKSKLNTNKTIKTLNKWLKFKYLECYGETFYNTYKPRILIEKYLENENGELYDYKLYCFNGKVYYVRVDIDRFTQHKTNLYDLNFNKIDCTLGHPNFNKVFTKPKKYEKMLQYAEILSKDFKHVRVDFFNVDGEIYFGEMTFTSGAGFDKILPYSFDLHMGELFNLK